MSINLSTSEGIIAEDLISSHIDFYPNSEGSGSGTNSFKTVAARSSGQSNSESKLGESVDRIIFFLITCFLLCRLYVGRHFTVLDIFSNVVNLRFGLPFWISIEFS